MEVWLLLCAACASVPLLYLLWKHHPSYGANPSGPTFPLVGILPFVFLNKHRLYEWTCDLFDRSPSLTRRSVVGRRVFVSTADPRAIQHILQTHFSSYPKGPSFYPYFADLLGDGIFNCDGALWRFQRKVASHEFTSNSLRDFVFTVADAEICGRLLPAIEAAMVHSGGGFIEAAMVHSGGGFIDLQALLLKYTFDTICQLTFGADPACLDISKLNKGYVQGHAISRADGCMRRDVPVHTSYSKVPQELIDGFVQGFQAALKIVAERFLVPRCIWETKRYLKAGSEKTLVEALAAVDKFTSFVIEQSKRELEAGKDRKDMLARFMRMSKAQVQSLLEGGQDETAPSKASGTKEKQGQAISDSLLKDILLSFILAGHETVASGVTFAMWLLSLHPRVEEALLKEINEITKERESNEVPMGHGTERDAFTYDEVKKMNYLHAVLSESMRLYPPVPADCKYAMKDDTFPDGTEVPKGCMVSYNVFAMGRAERIWGKDCLEFHPERWLDEHGQFVPASSYKYPVFQAGPRVCLGREFAFIQMKLLVASLVQGFEFALQSGFKPKLSYGVSMTMVNGLPVSLKRRKGHR